MIHPSRPVGQQEVADHYDDLDSFYREVWGEHVHHGLWRTGRETTEEAVAELVRHLAARLGLAPGMRVVDIGSGYGATARQLAAEAGALVTAMTISPVQHAFARGVAAETRGGGTVEYVLGDWMTNSFADGGFDRAVAIESTEHMVDKAGAFRHVGRVLAPEGMLGMYAWIAADLPADWMVKRLLEPICLEGRLPGLGTEADYRGLLEQAGLVVEGVEDLSSAVAATWTHSARRLAKRIVSDTRYRRYLLSPRSRNREFALTVLRILLAYRTGAMRYLLFLARRPGSVPRGAP